MQSIHGTCVDLSGTGVLLRGPSGAGKSDLALRLVEAGWRLVADDRVELSAEGGCLVARAPRGFEGLIEARGVGIARVAWVGSSRVALVVDLVMPAAVPRLPEPASIILAGVSLPRLALTPFEASTPLKLRLAANGAIIPSDVMVMPAAPSDRRRAS